MPVNLLGQHREWKYRKVFAGACGVLRVMGPQMWGSKDAVASQRVRFWRILALFGCVHNFGDRGQISLRQLSPSFGLLTLHPKNYNYQIETEPRREKSE